MSTNSRNSKLLPSLSPVSNPAEREWDKVANDPKAALLTLLGTLGGAGALGAGTTMLSGLLRKRKIPTSMPDTVDTELPTQKVAFNLSDLYPTLADAGSQALSHIGTQQAAHPWLVPGMALGAPLALNAGSDIGGSLIHKLMKWRQHNEMDDAKKDFEDAIKPKGAVKLSSIYEELEKQGAPDLSPGLQTGLQYGGAGLLGLLAAYGGRSGYNYADSRTNESLLNKAIKNKNYLQSLRQPQSIHISADPDNETAS